MRFLLIVQEGTNPVHSVRSLGSVTVSVPRLCCPNNKAIRASGKRVGRSKRVSCVVVRLEGEVVVEGGELVREQRLKCQCGCRWIGGEIACAVAFI